MYLRTIVTVGVVLFAGAAFAQTSGTAPSSSGSSPGRQMQDATKSTGPGASEYAPGQRAKKEKSSGPGASEFAPGHSKSNTGSSGTNRK